MNLVVTPSATAHPHSLNDILLLAIRNSPSSNTFKHHIKYLTFLLQYPFISYTHSSHLAADHPYIHFLWQCRAVGVINFYHQFVILLLESPQSRPHWYPSPRPASPCVQCKHAHCYRSASAPDWLTTPTLTTPTVSGRLASQSPTLLVSPTTLWF